MAATDAPQRTAVSWAVDLGWRLAEFYDSKRLPGPPENPPTELPPHLGGLGMMSGYEKATALTAHVAADISALNAALRLTLPSPSAITDALATHSHQRDDVRRPIYELYTAVRDVLAGGDPNLARAFGLGRMLADTACLPKAHVASLIGEEFRAERLWNAYAWLADLDSALPPRAAGAVAQSLRAWEVWVDERRVPDGTVDATKVDDVAIRALHRQGELWRRLLTGEVAPERLLSVDAYAAAVDGLLKRWKALTWNYVTTWWKAVAATVAAVIVVAVAAVLLAATGGARVAAVLVPAAGLLGVSWAGIRATLGRALRTAEAGMWEAEVVVALGEAATILPRPETDKAEPPEEENEEPEPERSAAPVQGSPAPPTNA